MELNDVINVCNEMGEELSFKLLFSFEYGKNNEQYIVYTDSNETSKDINLYCSQYVPTENGLYVLRNVEDEDILKCVDEYMENYNK